MAASSCTETGDFSTVEVWLANLEQVEKPLENLAREYTLLSADEIKEFAIADNTNRQRMRRTARMVLRLLLNRYFGPEISQRNFEIGPQGRPKICGLNGDFNLAHAGGYALVGLGSVSPIGVDLEAAREVRISTSRRSALIAAAEEISNGKPLPLSENGRSLQAWTRLEAFAKAEGYGIGRVLSRFGIWGNSASAPSQNTRASSFSVCDLVLDTLNLHAAVCLPQGVKSPIVKHLPTDYVSLLNMFTNGGAQTFHSAVDLSLLSGQKSMKRSVAQPG